VVAYLADLPGTVIGALGAWVLGWKLVSFVMPPPENFDEWPRFQSRYRLFGKFVKYWGSLDLRAFTVRTFYPAAWDKIKGQNGGVK